MRSSLVKPARDALVDTGVEIHDLLFELGLLLFGDGLAGLAALVILRLRPVFDLVLEIGSVLAAANGLVTLPLVLRPLLDGITVPVARFQRQGLGQLAFVLRFERCGGVVRGGGLRLRHRPGGGRHFAQVPRGLEPGLPEVQVGLDRGLPDRLRFAIGQERLALLLQSFAVLHIRLLEFVLDLCLPGLPNRLLFPLDLLDTELLLDIRFQHCRVADAEPHGAALAVRVEVTQLLDRTAAGHVRVVRRLVDVDQGAQLLQFVPEFIPLADEVVVPGDSVGRPAFAQLLFDAFEPLRNRANVALQIAAAFLEFLLSRSQLLDKGGRILGAPAGSFRDGSGARQLRGRRLRETGPHKAEGERKCYRLGKSLPYHGFSESGAMIAPVPGRLNDTVGRGFPHFVRCC
jgi:hypothetical protein